MPLYKFIRSIPPRILFILVGAAVVTAIVFHNKNKEEIIESAAEYRNNTQHSNQSGRYGAGRRGLAVENAGENTEENAGENTGENTGKNTGKNENDFSGGLIHFYESEGVTQLTFEDDMLFDRTLNRLQISKRIIKGFSLISEYDAEKRYVFTYEPVDKTSGTKPAPQQYFLEDGISSITTDAANNEITLHTAEFSAFEITEDDQYFYIQPLPPREKYQKIVMLDPGHGGEDSGAERTKAGDRAKTAEKDINLTISQMVLDLFNKNLSQTGVKAYMIRYGDDTIHRTERPPLSNGLADMFVSIHCNTYPDDTVSGTQTFFDSDGARDLSRATVTNRQLAQILQTKIVSAISTKDRKIEIDHELVVLNRARVPAALIELAYMTNPNDLDKLTSSEYHAKIAEAIYEGIIEAFEYEE